MVKRPSAATAIALVALFFSLGGAGMAASRLVDAPASRLVSTPGVYTDVVWGTVRKNGTIEATGSGAWAVERLARGLYHVFVWRQGGNLPVPLVTPTMPLVATVPRVSPYGFDVRFNTLAGIAQDARFSFVILLNDGKRQH